MAFRQVRPARLHGARLPALRGAANAAAARRAQRAGAQGAAGGALHADGHVLDARLGAHHGRDCLPRRGQGAPPRRRVWPARRVRAGIRPLQHVLRRRHARRAAVGRLNRDARRLENADVDAGVAEWRERRAFCGFFFSFLSPLYFMFSFFFL